MLTQFAPTLYMDMSACLHIPKNSPMTHLRTICLCVCSYLDLHEGMCWDKHLKIYRGVCCWNNMINFFASLSAKPLNGATPSYSSVQGTWIQKYGDVIYVFGDADLGPCKVTNLVAGSLLWFSCHMWQIRGLPKKPNPKKRLINRKLYPGEVHSSKLLAWGKDPWIELQRNYRNDFSQHSSSKNMFFSKCLENMAYCGWFFRGKSWWRTYT